MAKDPDKQFIGKVSKYGPGRSHIEIPKDKRDSFKPGKHVRVEQIE